MTTTVLPARARLLQSALPQVLQSLTSFLMTLGFAHALTPMEFGTLSAFWLIWMLVLSFDRTVFGEQLLARAHSGDPVVGYGSLLFVWLLPLAVITMGVAAFAPPTVRPGIVFIVLFVMSDAVRYRILHEAEHGHRRWSLLALELARMLLAVCFLAAMSAGAGFLWQSILALAVGSVLLLPVATDVRRLRLDDARSWWRGMGRFEATMGVQFFTLTAVQQVMPLVAASLFSAAAFGSLRLTQAVVSPAALVATAMQPALISHFAREVDPVRRRSLLGRSVVAASLAATLISLVGVTAVLLTGQWWIPADQRSLVSTLILPALVAVACVVVGQPGGALIRVQQLGRESLAGQLIGVLATVAAVVVLAPTGIVGFAWALTIGAGVTVFATYLLIARRV